MAMESRVTIGSRALAAMGVCAAAATLSGCDPTANASVENHCGFPVEVTMDEDGTPSVVATKTIADGEVWSDGTVAYEIDVVVRVPGDTEWSVRIPWEDLKGSGGQDGVPVRLEGEFCPS